MQSVTNMERKGITVAGTLLVDNIYEISAYPKEGELTKIRSIELALGGLVSNCGIGIKKLCPEMPVYALAKIGNDDRGNYAKKVLQENGIDVKGVSYSSKATSFTDVMSVSAGQRTFFTYAGASEDFGYEDIPWDNLSCKMLHLGYFLLLDKIDNGDGLKILAEAKKRGIVTSIDLVSENSDRYAKILPCLTYVDNLIINEVEASGFFGMQATDDNLVEIAKKLLDAGVRERVIIHTSKKAVCVEREKVTTLNSFELPKGYIKGSTGAGDAFCSGALIGIYNGYSQEEILNLAQASAVASLSKADATSGLKEMSAVLEQVKNYKRK